MQYELQSEDMPVEEQVNMSLEYDALRTAVKELDIISQQVLFMKYYYEKSYNEIADELGLTSKDVDNIIYHARKKLRKKLNPH